LRPRSATTRGTRHLIAARSTATPGDIALKRAANVPEKVPIGCCGRLIVTSFHGLETAEAPRLGVAVQIMGIITVLTILVGKTAKFEFQSLIPGRPITAKTT
jgi:hypothetical protein